MKAFSPLLFAVLAAHLYGTPTLGTVNAVPTTAVVGTPTEISVQASITDPTLLAGGANLLQLNPNGTTTILGTLHDDGLHGDAYAGDLTFTLVVTLNVPAAGQIQLQVSAAFQGVLQRVKSPVINVFFQPANAPQQAIAALAKYLSAGNTSAASNYLAPSYGSVLGTLSQQALSGLAAIISTGALVSSQNDLRIFQAPFVAPDETTTTLEFSMVPGPNGQWVVNTW
jgi:hypothetical protein